MDSLPVEVLSNILDNVSISDAENVSNCTKDGSKGTTLVARDRKNVCTYLHKLVDDPLELLRLMLKTNSALVGRCVSAFMYPELRDHVGPWEMYCYGDVLQMALLIHSLANMGFSPTAVHSARPFTEPIILYMTGERSDIIIFKAHMRNIFATMIAESMSVDRCCITGYGVMSINHGISERGICYGSYHLDPACRPTPAMYDPMRLIGIDSDDVDPSSHITVGDFSYLRPHGTSVYGASVEAASSIELCNYVTTFDWGTLPYAHPEVPKATTRRSACVREDFSNCGYVSFPALMTHVLMECEKIGLFSARGLVTLRLNPTYMELSLTVLGMADQYSTHAHGALAGKVVRSYFRAVSGVFIEVSPLQQCLVYLFEGQRECECERK